MRQYGWNPHRNRYGWSETGGYSRPPRAAHVHVPAPVQGPIDPAHDTPEMKKARLDACTAEIIAQIRARKAARRA